MASDKAVSTARMAKERGVRMLAARAELALMRRQGRGCTCADPVYHPDPNCGECARRIQRQASEIGYGP